MAIRPAVMGRAHHFPLALTAQECAWKCSKVEASAKGKQERPSLPPDDDDSEQEEEEYLGTKMGPKATLPNFLHKVSMQQY